jgi:signal transduction histidine kinase
VTTADAPEPSLQSLAASPRVRELFIEADRGALAGSLAGGIAHDLRGPLQALTMVTDPQPDLLDWPEAARLGQALNEAVRRLTLAIARFSRIYAPHRGEPGPLAAAEVLGNVAELQRLQRGLPAVTVELRLPDRLAAVRGAEADLQHLLLGLITNAKQALGERRDGRIVLGAAAADDVVLLTVEDNGPGMTSGVLARAFEPFFSTRPGHAGIGLTVGRWLAERQSGGLALEPGERGGVVATVSLPAWKRTAE